MALQILRLENRNSPVNLGWSLWLFFPHAMRSVPFCPANQIGSHYVWHAASQALRIYDVKITWNGLGMRLELSRGRHGWLS